MKKKKQINFQILLDVKIIKLSYKSVIIYFLDKTLPNHHFLIIKIIKIILLIYNHYLPTSYYVDKNNRIRNKKN